MTTHATTPNEMIHFDYLYMGPGLEEMLNSLVIQDDLSSYRWLIPCQKADSAVVSSSLAHWIRVFTVMNVWVFDQGSHFKNSVIDELAKLHRINHNFTVSYSPWINGTVENAMRHVRAAVIALL